MFFPYNLYVNRCIQLCASRWLSVAEFPAFFYVTRVLDLFLAGWKVGRSRGVSRVFRVGIELAAVVLVCVELTLVAVVVVYVELTF